MSSLNQLISEIAHSVQQADSVPVRRAIREGIIHARNELIRHSYSNHNYTDKVLKQKYNVTLTKGNDDGILVSTNDIPKPVRFTNNLPFHSVRTLDSTKPIVLCAISEGVRAYYGSLPGMKCAPSYDYYNNKLYVYGLDDTIDKVCIESVFEYPSQVVEGGINDNDEFFLPEDLVNSVKKLVLETFNPQVVRDTNEIPTPNLLK